MILRVQSNLILKNFILNFVISSVFGSFVYEGSFQFEFEIDIGASFLVDVVFCFWFFLLLFLLQKKEKENQASHFVFLSR